MQVESPPSTEPVRSSPHARGNPQTPWARALGALRPSHAHTAFTATLVLMVSTFLSRIIGLVRVKYILWLFGRGVTADALNAAFVLPDMISYFLVGGAGSIAFVTILTGYRDTGREQQGQRSLSVILSTMYIVLGAAIVLAEIFAPWYIHWWFSGYDADKAALTVKLTRILLPAQLCFFAGGVFGAVLLVRKQFNVQAVSPLIYNLGTIVGGLLLVKQLGVSALAIGTTAGAFFGPFLLNWIYARRAGTHYRWILDWKDEGLRAWVRLSLPLMAGVSLVTADSWIIAHYASAIGGAVSQFTYAKLTFTAPMAVLAQAAGAASMPFFANLWAQKKRFEFATQVADSVSRVACLALLASSLMVSLGLPIFQLFFVGGRFSAADARECATYFAVFSISMFLWSAQAIYARAFYAAGNTFAPMAAGTVVTLVSLPMYAALFQWQGAMGLAIASDIGIAIQTVTIAVMLHQKQMVSLVSLDYAEMGRCAVAGLSGGVAVWAIFTGLLRVFWRVLGHDYSATSRWVDLAILVLGTGLWLGIVKWVLEKSGSMLPGIAMKRLKLG